jgi:sulfoquinovosidase
VTHLVSKLLEHEVPLAAVWIQDWVGLRKAFDGDRLKWNWQLDSTYYPDWNGMVKQWGEEHGIRVMTYINPFFSETEGGVTSPGARNLYKEGVTQGYFVQSPQGGSYKMHSGSIEFCMLDTTNPAARTWMKDIMKKDMIENSGSAGWMADFGEYLPFDAVLHGRQNAAEYHNVYPEEWARINREAVEEAALDRGSHLKLKRQLTNGIAPTDISKKGLDTEFMTVDREVLYFMRSAGLKSPAHTALFWLGDQLVSWDKHDGLKSAIVGALSGGIGGHSITHSDIGGYTMVR